MLIRDPLLAQCNLAYLDSYNVIICKDFKDSQTCGYSLTLDTLISHLDGVAHLVSDRTPHWPHAHNDLRNKKAAGAFWDKVLSLYPNVCKTVQELCKIMVSPHQRGPILGIHPPINAYRCQFKDSENVQCTQLVMTMPTMDKHWVLHKVPKDYNK